MIFVTDVLIKSLLIYASAAVTTLGLIIVSGFEPVMPIILVAISISSLHFICLYFAIRVIARYRLNDVESNFARPGSLHREGSAEERETRGAEIPMLDEYIRYLNREYPA